MQTWAIPLKHLLGEPFHSTLFRPLAFVSTKFMQSMFMLFTNREMLSMQVNGVFFCRIIVYWMQFVIRQRQIDVARMGFEEFPDLQLDSSDLQSLRIS